MPTKVERDQIYDAILDNFAAGMKAVDIYQALDIQERFFYTLVKELIAVGRLVRRETGEYVVPAEANGNAIQTYEPQGELNQAEYDRLTLLETQVETGFAALYAIREERLWRQYESFEAYCAARWGGDNPRRRNQILAGLRVYVALQDQLGTGVPGLAPSDATTEYALRPLVSITESAPEVAAEIYQQAVEFADGGAPSHTDILLAKRLILTPEQVEKEDVLAQLDGMKRYGWLAEEVRTGESKPSVALGLAVALDSCNESVRAALIEAKVREIALVRLLNDHFARGSDTAKEVVTTGYLQFGERAIPLTDASAKDFRTLLDINYREHQQQQRDAKKGKAVSVVVFAGDAQGTLESLEAVLDGDTLVELAELILED